MCTRPVWGLFRCPYLKTRDVYLKECSLILMSLTTQNRHEDSVIPGIMLLV